MNKAVSIIIILALVVAIGIIFTGGSDTTSAQNVEIRDGVQYVKINTGGGYFPRMSVAEAGIPTKLIMETEGTFDCSSALVIKSLNYQKILPQSGETEIDAGVFEAGEKLQGVCSMGMYNFQVEFQ